MRLAPTCLLVSCLGDLTAQESTPARVLAALDRWKSAYVAGGIDLVDRDTSSGSWSRDKPDAAPGDLDRFRRLVDLAVCTGSPAVIDRLLALRELRFPNERWRWDMRVLREVVDGALAAAPEPVQADMFFVARDCEATASRRAQAIRTLAVAAQRFFAGAVEGMLGDASPVVRAAAADALGELGTPPATVGALAMMLHFEEEDEGIAASLGALTRLLRDGAAPSAVRAQAANGRHEPVEATAGNIAQAMELTKAYEPGGSTDLWSALALALAMTSPGPGGERDPVEEVFVLSDGIASGGGLTDPGAIARQVAAATGTSGTRVHCIAAWGGEGGSLMRTIARRSGGEFRHFFVE